MLSSILATVVATLILIAPAAWAISAHRRANDAIQGVPRMASRKRAAADRKIAAAPAVITAAQMGICFPQTAEIQYRGFETPTFTRRGFETAEVDAFGIDFDDEGAGL